MHCVIVGLGSIGRRHAANLARIVPNAALTYVRRADVPDGLDRRLGDPRVTDLSEALDGPVDLAILATPSGAHIEHLPELIRRACPLLVEKPIVSEAEDCDKVDEVLREAPPAVRASGYNLRYLSSLRHLRQYVVSGSLGNIVRASFVAGQWLPAWRPRADYRSTYSADRHSGGGVELDLSHEFDVARWIFGELDLKYAAGGHFSSLEIRSNDTSVSVLTPVGHSAPLIFISLDYVAHGSIRRYEVVGDRGRVEWDFRRGLHLYQRSGDAVASTNPAEFDISESYVRMLEELLATIMHGTATTEVQSIEDGLATTRLALRARDAVGTP